MVFPRWKLILLILIGVYSGFMLDKEPSFGVIWSLLMIWELTKKILNNETICSSLNWSDSIFFGTMHFWRSNNL